MSKYTAHEQTVILHFFTNASKSVYAARDAMPSELWANLAGGASRSNLDLRDRFLKIFKDVAVTEEAYTQCMESMAASITSMELAEMVPVLAKATDFMAKWAGPNYGHNSLKDSCVDRIIVDRVSIRVAKLLEETALGAFQEKSTRYMDFSTATPVFPETSVSTELSNYSNRLLEKSSAIYSEMTHACIDYYVRTLPDADFKDAAAKKRTATAKAFDTARYCLLVNKPTALAFTIPSRETERHIARLLAHENLEVRSLAKEIKQGAQKINPSMITHVEPNAFQAKPVDMTCILEIENKPAQVINESGCIHWSDEPRVELVSGDASLVGLAACVYLANQTTGQASGYDDAYQAIVETKYPELTAMKILEHRLEWRGKHDELPREFGFGEYIYDIIVDYGAYRDLQRHRVGTQIVSTLNCANGFTVPALLRETGFEQLLAKYIAYMEEVAEIHALYRAYDPSAAEYWFALGHNVRFTYACNFKQLVYLVELRSRAQGHLCYRMIAIEMFDQLVENHSIGDVELSAKFNTLFRIDRTRDTDRRSQENTQAARKEV